MPQTILARVQTPPKSWKCLFELGKFFSKKVPQTIRARVETPPPYGQCPNAPRMNFSGASLSANKSVVSIAQYMTDPNSLQLLWYSSLPCHRLPGINSANLLRKCQLYGKVKCTNTQIHQSVEQISTKRLNTQIHCLVLKLSWLLFFKEVDCRRIFETRPTDMGLCCAFNAKDSLKT